MIVQGIQIARRLWKWNPVHKKGNTPYKIYLSRGEILKRKYSLISPTPRKRQTERKER